MTDPGRWHQVIEAGTAAIAALAGDQAALARPVPTCPDWTLRQLVTHVGRTHRWAAEITATRSAEFIDFRSVPDGKFPADAAQAPGWLTAGAQRLLSALRGAGSEPVWAFGEQRPAFFWARRMAHETAIHAQDAWLAAGQPGHGPDLDPALAADGIDEWLTVMSGPLFGRSDPRLTALPAGRSVHVHATAGELPSSGGEWLVSHGADGISVSRAHGKADVAASGPAAELLLVLVRRLAPEASSIRVDGDRDLLRRWLAGTPW